MATQPKVADDGTDLFQLSILQQLPRNLRRNVDNFLRPAVQDVVDNNDPQALIVNQGNLQGLDDLGRLLQSLDF